MKLLISHFYSLIPEYVVDSLWVYTKLHGLTKGFEVPTAMNIFTKVSRGATLCGSGDRFNLPQKSASILGVP
jgi:hypothetical protein